MGMIGAPFCGGGAFAGIVAFSMMACFLWPLGGFYFGWVRAGFPLAVRRARFPLAVRIFFIGGNALCFFSNELLQIEYLIFLLI